MTTTTALTTTNADDDDNDDDDYRLKFSVLAVTNNWQWLQRNLHPNPLDESEKKLRIIVDTVAKNMNKFVSGNSLLEFCPSRAASSSRFSS